MDKEDTLMVKLNRVLMYSISMILLILTLNHWYRFLNYKPWAFLLMFWIIASFIIIRVEDSKF